MSSSRATEFRKPYSENHIQKTMIRQVLLLLLLGAPLACASDYFVDCNYGSNGNPGSSPQQAWRSLLQVGISSFQPGDTINLKRDCTWNETLTPPSSGNSGSLIKIDSYGNGRPPHLTGYLPIAAGAGAAARATGLAFGRRPRTCCRDRPPSQGAPKAQFRASRQDRAPGPPRCRR